MATLMARWLLSILLTRLSYCFAKSGLPAPPSDPNCIIPCYEKDCWFEIHCTWDPRLDPQIPTNYSLHWEAENSNEGHVISETISSGSIHREHFSSHEELYVWVEAKNQHGSSISQKVVFNPADIIKPPPPEVMLSLQETFEIEWSSIPICEQLQLSAPSCEVQQRTEADQVWLQYDCGSHVTYTLDNPQPCVVYEVQVRCACGTNGKRSDWSKILPVFQGTAPVGQLDIWRDCGIFHPDLDCILTWKKLPKSQECTLILGYKVKLEFYNGTAMLMNLSTTGPSNQLVCDRMQCYLNSSLKNVSWISISAYNNHGDTEPSHLAMPGQITMCRYCHQTHGDYEQHLYLKMNEENLTVSWNQPSEVSDNMIENVIQYKQVGSPLGQGFSWIKVKKNQTSGFFKGQFIKFTPYNVSLFSVSYNSEVQHLSSVIQYSFEGTPPRVPSFKVVFITATEVTLFWEYVPVPKQNGVILFYQIGVDGQNVHSVNASLRDGNDTFVLKPLSPDKEYKVWIRAVTAAGPGENTTRTFKTKQYYYGHLIKILLSVLGVLFVIMTGFAAVLFNCCRGQNKACQHCFCDKVPDPGNSHIFTQMKHQLNDPLAWLCLPIYYEPHPKISMLEILEMQPGSFKSSLRKTSNRNGLIRSIVEDACLQVGLQNDQKEDVVTEVCDRTEDRYRREDYSKMVDSDEERDREREEDGDDCWNSSEEEQFTSGYEKHFMPTASEIVS